MSSSLPDTLRVLLTGFASMAKSTASESTLSGSPDLTLSLRFLQPEQIFIDYLGRFHFLHNKYFLGCFLCIMIQFEPVKSKSLISATLDVYL